MAGEYSRARAMMKVGAHLLEGSEKGCAFTVWAPLLDKVAVHLVKTPAVKTPLKTPLKTPRTEATNTSAHQLFEMSRDERGYWRVSVPGVSAGTRYLYQLEGGQLEGEQSWPDPASSFQPEGVHGPSEVIDHSEFAWQDAHWQGVELAEYIIYELHIGTFTPEGTFAAAIARLSDLVELGITAIEIMPVAQFPGDHNWGYDGVFPFAVQNSYGGPTGFKQLIDACHQQGLAVILDVVYNHFGPEGNYTGKYGPYTTEHYRTPWGNAINFDDAYSDGVRHYFIQNALSWLRDYHIDALRLDAVHAIYDFGAKHFLQALAEAVAELAKERSYSAYLIAESDLNDPRLIRSVEKGGYQLDAQWSDDFHHALHCQLTGDDMGYYSDFTELEALASAIQNRFVYAGQYSFFRHRKHGSPALDLSSEKFVICNQNHDQIGNRMMGDRLASLISFEGQKLAAGATLLLPYLPLLFMGEEYGEKAPFLYFIDHGDKDLIEAVRAGRKEEFSHFHTDQTPPDPASLDTFKQCILRWPSAPNVLNKFYKRLIELRKACQIMTPAQSSEISAQPIGDVLYYRRTLQKGDLLCVMNFGEHTQQVELPLGNQTWHQHIYSADAQWSPSQSAGQLASRSTSEFASEFTHNSDSRTRTLPKVISLKTTPTLPLAPLSIALYQAD
jgi:maltooligosyltrehalose trehalohydrolase